ncbi:hypothetical protein BMS3Bbin16_00542 [archaeon BMS3Bbin16]|nr:hypothetical protein BMS3Bbin16_00542 [archaeon BMS3Bbin16]
MTMNLKELISKNINLKKGSNKRESIPIVNLNDLDILYEKKVSKDLLFERNVFNYLLNNKSRLGINELFKFKNVRIDGALKLRDSSELILLEIKYRLNWFKTCNARIEFQLFKKNFYEKLTEDSNEIRSGLIIFEEFSGDWKRKADCRRLQNGWSYFYEEENFLKSNDFKTHIVQLKNNKLVTVDNYEDIIELSEGR